MVAPGLVALLVIGAVRLLKGVRTPSRGRIGVEQEDPADEVGATVWGSRRLGSCQVSVGPTVVRPTQTVLE
jgi:hypothetical protein